MQLHGSGVYRLSLVGDLLAFSPCSGFFRIIETLVSSALHHLIISTDRQRSFLNYQCWFWNRHRDKSCYEHDHAYDSQSDHESDEENEEHRYHAKSRAKHQKKHGGGGTDNESNNNESDGKENEDRENKTPKPVTSVKKGEQMATDEVSDSDNLYGA